MKKKCGYSRELIVNLNIHKNTKIKMGEYLLEIGNISADGFDNTVDITRFYERPNGKPKIEEQYTITSPKSTTLNSKELFLKFNRIFVIDTSYEQIIDQKVCAAAIGELIWDEQKKIYGLYKTAHLKFTLDSNDTNNPEKYSWSILIDNIIKLNTAKLEYGIVVDSELGSLKSYNNGKPYFNNKVLPKNINFIYATDKGNTLLNWAMKQCDKASKEIKNDFKNTLIQTD